MQNEDKAFDGRRPPRACSSANSRARRCYRNRTCARCRNITANFGASPPTRAALTAIYNAAATPLILSMRLECDGARGNCQPSTLLWRQGMGGVIHVCPAWIAQADALSRHRALYQSVLSNVVGLPGNPWRYVDLARDLERRSDLDRPLPSLPSDPFPQSTEPGAAIG